MAQTMRKPAQAAKTPTRPRLDRARKQMRDEKLGRTLEATFPASDPISQIQPSGGTTANEPPPLGQKTGKPRR